MKIKDTLLSPFKAVGSFIRAVQMIQKTGGDWGKLWKMSQEARLFGNRVTKPYSQDLNVYKAVKAIADNVPQAELVFKDYKTEKEIYPEELVKLFQRPNPLMTGNDFKQACAGFYALFGELYILKRQSIGQAIGTSKLPAELWILDPSKIQEILDKETKELTGWRYGETTYQLNEVMFCRDFNPYSLIRGIAPTVPLEKILDIAMQALNFNKAFFDNDANPGMVFKTEKGLTDIQRERLLKWWKARYQGANKKFMPAVLEGGLSIDNPTPSHKDMDFVEQQKYTREETLGTWRAPKALFNITEDLNYATFMGQMKIFWLYGIEPILRKLEDMFNAHLILDYNALTYCEFDNSNVPAFKEEFKEKVTTAQILTQMGFTANEVNEKLQLGFENKPWRDVFLVPFSMIPVEDLINGEKTPAGDNTDIGKGIDLKHAKVRDVVWKQFLNRHVLGEVKLTGVIKRFFYEQRKKVLAQLEEKKARSPIEISLDWEAENLDLIKRTSPYILNSIKQGVELGRDVLPIEVNEVALEARLNAYLSVRADKITGINNTIKEQLRETLAEGLKEGDSIATLADRVREIYNMATNRSKVIARTETTGAMNGGSELYYQEAGVEKKEWITAGDERVRADHEIMQGEIVDVNKKFSNGLDFPGGDGAPEQVINCRCTILPVVE